MQLLPPAVEAVASDRCIYASVMLAVEFFAVTAVVLVSFTHMLQFARDEFQDNDVVEVTDDRYIVRENVFGITEVHEGGEDSLPIRNRQLPFVICKHLQHRLEFREARGDEIGQWFALPNIIDDAANGIDDLGFVRTAYNVA